MKKLTKFIACAIILSRLLGFNIVTKSHATASNVPTDGRAIWTGAHAAIPANWSRDTDFDTKFLQGDPTAGTDAGATHDHDSNFHTHNPNSHTHTVPNVALGAPTGGTVNIFTGLGTNVVGSAFHSHTTVTSNAATYTLSSSSITLINVAPIPPSMQIIVIKPDDASQNIPDDAVVLADAASQSVNFEITNGTGTIDLIDLFFLTETTEADAGDPTGTATHTHAFTFPDHTHTPVVHGMSHGNVTMGPSSTTNGANDGGVSTHNGSTHHLASSFTNASGNISNDAVTLSSESNEPSHAKLLGLQNKGGGAETPLGIIIPFVGTTVPSGWVECDGNNDTLDLTSYQVKVTTITDDIGDTGGTLNSHTHTEAIGGHGHTENIGHAHNFNMITTRRRMNTGGSIIPDDTHGHSGTLATSINSATIQNSTSTWNTSDGRRGYRTVKWIKKVPSPTFRNIFFLFNPIGIKNESEVDV